MTLTPQFLDELRARTLLSAVIAPSVKLTKAGREWKACCPFHNEKTPSFTVNDEKGFYHCLAGETLVMTTDGRRPIAELAGKRARVLSRGAQWIEAEFRSYGTQQLWAVHLRRNRVAKVLHATDGHRWFVRGRTFALRTDQLKPGYRLETAAPPPCPEWVLDPAGIRHGILFGDGTSYLGGYGTVNLHGEKNRQLAMWFPQQKGVERTTTTGKPYLRIYGGKSFGDCKSLPAATYGKAYLLGFLAGYLAADGHVSKDGTIILNSARRENLEAVRDIATRLGIVTYGVTTQQRIGIDGILRPLHRVHFLPATMNEALFLLSQAKDRFRSSTKRFGRLRWTVLAVEPTDRVEEVFCAEVPGEHAFALDDHILTGNCFGCGAHGDAIRFLTDARGLPFMDAVKELAGKAGLDVPAPDPQSRERAERTASLTDVMASVQSWFAEQLQGIDGASARDYLKRRGIDAATVTRFGLGLAPEGRTKLKSALIALGEDRLIETGMLIKPDDDGATYDRFRGRLMIPIRDQRGRVIAFGGRVLGDGEPKYLNSPETSLFDKGRTLYNIDRAGPASRTAKRLIVVEGYMDVIALDRAGISEVVAPNGTAVTEAQLDRMWRLNPAPILCFDGDSAGQRAAIRAAARALPHLAPERTLRFAELPAGQDPDDLIKSGGRAAFEAVVAAAEPLDARLWRHEYQSAPLTTPEARAGLRQRLLAHASAIGDQSLARLYRDEWLSRFDIEVGRRQFQQSGPRPRNAPRGRFDKGKFVPPILPPGSTARSIGSSGIDPQTARALMIGFVNFPDALADHAEQLAELGVADAAIARVRDALVDSAFSGAKLDRDRNGPIFRALGVAGGSPSRSALSFSFTRADMDPDRACTDLAAAVEILTASEQVDRALAQATERCMQDTSQEAYDEQQRLIAVQQRLKQRLASLAGTD